MLSGSALILVPELVDLESIILSSGKYNRLFPPSTSIITLDVLANTDSTVSRYSLSLVTCGAFSYSLNKLVNLIASPSADLIILTLYAFASSIICLASPRASGIISFL